MIPALGRQRPVDLCEFEASLVYRESSRIARAGAQRNLSRKKRKKKKKKFEEGQINNHTLFSLISIFLFNKGFF